MNLWHHSPKNPRKETVFGLAHLTQHHPHLLTLPPRPGPMEYVGGHLRSDLQHGQKNPGQSLFSADVGPGKGPGYWEGLSVRQRVEPGSLILVICT